MASLLLLAAMLPVSHVAAAAATQSTPSASQPCGHAGTPPARYDHVVWIWMENHRRSSVIGSPNAPYETYTAALCGNATDYRDVSWPSLPNYIAATSGSDQGIRDDSSPALHPLRADNVFRQVRASGGSAITYADTMPAACALTSTSRYAVKHNPAAYFQGGSDRAACGRDDLPLGSLSDGALVTALRNDTLPTFTVVIPDICHDTHDCLVRTGDTWLSQLVPQILDSHAYRGGRTAVFIVWDEPRPMPFIVIAPTVPHGAVVGLAIDHYALLRTTEELLALNGRLGIAATAPSLRGRFGL